MRTIARLSAALTLAVGCAWIPLDAALACSCMFPGYRDAIASADVAFVGTVVAENEPGALGGGDIMPTATYAFTVERSKAPMVSPFELAATFGGGANCGFDMAVGEEWLVIASGEGPLETNLCNGTARVDELDADTRLVLDAALEPNDAPAAPEPAPSVPMPVLVAAVGVLVLGVVSLLAFRREAR